MTPKTTTLTFSSNNKKIGTSKLSKCYAHDTWPQSKMFKSKSNKWIKNQMFWLSGSCWCGAGPVLHTWSIIDIFHKFHLKFSSIVACYKSIQIFKLSNYWILFHTSHEIEHFRKVMSYIWKMKIFILTFHI